MSELIYQFLISIAISIFVIVFSKPIALKFDLVDRPNERKCHNGAIPLIGGIAIFISITITTILFIESTQEVSLYLIGAALIVLVGVLDDYYDLPVKPRVIAQIIVASIMIFGANHYIKNLGDLFGFGDVLLGFGGILITILAVLAAVNAFNMVDGIDGLAGMLALITFCALALLLSNNGSSWTFLAISFLGATMAYLVFNLRWPFKTVNKIFMGDAGSMLIGYSVVWLLVIGTQSTSPSFHSVTALWLIALPLMDMVAIMLRRVRKGDSPFKPDRGHLHHIFLRAGFSSTQTLVIISAISFVFVIFGICLEIFKIPESVSLLLFIICFMAYSFAIKHIWQLLTFYRRVFN